MKFKRALSGIMAGIIAITSSVASISPTAFAADDSTWDLPMLSVERASDTVIDSLYVNGWDPFDVDLRSFGIMNEFTTVTITCVTDETGIVGDDGEAPEAAFGVVINNNWDQATMPRCAYDSNETVFEKTLTAEQLENNPVFKVQSQIPVAATFTVTVSNLTPDGRAALSLAPLSENVTVNTYDASDWMNGGNCYGSVSIPAENISRDYAITYGSTTVGELRKNVKYISTSAIPYYGDSLDAGADAFAYKVSIVCGNGDVSSTISSEDNFDLTSPGTTYIDDLYTDELDSYELDSFVVYEIKIEISAKLFWNGEIEKNQAVSDKIRLAEPNKPVQLEIAYDPRIALPLPAVDEYSMVLTAEEGQDWLIGSYAYADYIVPDPVGKTYGNTTIGDLRKVLKKFNTTANTYVSDSLNAGENNFIYFIDMEANNGEDNIRFGNDSFRLTESGTVYVDNFDYKGTKISSGTYDDYVITAIIIKVQSALGWDDVEKKSFALCEDIRHMNPGDTMTLELAEDTRAEMKLPAVTGSMDVYVWENNEWLIGSSCSGDSDALTISGITYGETTLGDILDGYKTISGEVLPYVSDSLSIGKDAFNYTFGISLENDEFVRFDNWADFDETLTVNVDTLSFTEEQKALKINAITYHVEPKYEPVDEMQRAVNETVRGLKADTCFSILLTSKVGDVDYDGRVSAHDAALIIRSIIGLDDLLPLKCADVNADGTISASDANVILKMVTGENFDESDEDGAEDGCIKIQPSFTSVNIGDEITFEITTDVSITDGEFRLVSEGLTLSDYSTEVFSYFAEENSSFAFALPNGGTGTLLSVSYTVNSDADAISLKLIPAKGYESVVCGTEFTAQIHTKPANVKATAGDGQVTLTWDVASWATTYYIYSYLGNGQYALIGVTSDLSYTATGLTNGQEYQFLVRAFNSTDGSPYDLTDLVSATPQAKELDKPTVDILVGDSAVYVSWSVVPNATLYYVYFYNPSINGFDLYGVTTGNGCYVGNLVNGQTYGFLVRAFNDNGGSPYSYDDIAFVTLPANVAKPVVSAAPGDGEVTLSWNAVPSAIAYYIYSYLGNGQYALLGATSDLIFTATGLTNGQEYQFLVRAFSATDGSPYELTDLVSATPQAKGLAKPTVDITLGDSAVYVSWSVVPNATLYYVYFYNPTINGFDLYGVTTGNGCYVGNLVNGQTYGFLVRAFNDYEGSPYSYDDIVYAVPPNGIAKPNVVAATGSGQVVLSWSAVPNAVAYYVYSYLGNGQFALIGVTSDLSFTATGLTGGQEYRFLVRAFTATDGSVYDLNDLVSATPLAS